MKNVATADSPAARAMLFRLLLESTLVGVTPQIPQASGAFAVTQDQPVSLIMLRDSDGVVLPVFTSAEAVSRWRSEPTGIVALPAPALFEMAAANDINKIALDPGSQTGGYLTRDEIEQLARGRLPLGQTGDVVAEETEVRIGKPANPPSPEAITALRRQLAAQPRAQRAWYYLMQQGTQPPELVVAIELAPDGGPEAEARTMRTIIEAAGHECDAVGALLFAVPDENIKATLTAGAGELFFTRTTGTVQ